MWSCRENSDISMTFSNERKRNHFPFLLIQCRFWDGVKEGRERCSHQRASSQLPYTWRASRFFLYVTISSYPWYHQLSMYRHTYVYDIGDTYTKKWDFPDKVCFICTIFIHHRIVFRVMFSLLTQKMFAHFPLSFLSPWHISRRNEQEATFKSLNRMRGKVLSSM